MALFANEYKSRQMLAQCGIDSGEYALAKSRDEAVAITNKYGRPVVMKIVSDQIPHKTEAGGVALSVSGPVEAASQFDKLMDNARKYDPKAILEGVLIAPMLPSGVEVIVGGLRDPQFGPVVMFGIGGVFVEIFKDVQFRMAPLTEAEALAMIREVRGLPMLQGARGQKPVNLAVLAELIVKVGNCLLDNAEIKELDLNPVLCTEERILPLDASIMLG